MRCLTRGFNLAGAAGVAFVAMAPAALHAQSGSTTAVRDQALFRDERVLPVRRPHEFDATEQNRAAAAVDARRVAEEAQRRVFDAEERLKLEAAQRLAAEAEARRRTQEAEQIVADADAKRRAEAALRVTAAAEAKRKADEEQRVAALAEAQRLAQERQQAVAAEADARRKADEAQRIAAAADVRRREDEAQRAAVEAETRRKAEAEEQQRLAAEADARRKAEEAQRIAAEADAKRRADEAQRVAAEAETRRKAEEQQRLAAEADARRKAEEAQRIAAEAAAKRRADEAQRVAAEAETRRKAEEQQRLAAEADARRKADEAQRIAAEADAKRSALPQQSASLVAASPPASVQQACGTTPVLATPLSGGRVNLQILDGCRAGQPWSVRYGVIEFTRRLDAAGRGALLLDLFQGSNEAIIIEFADGSREAITVVSPDLARVTKIAVVWRGPELLDLQAFEFAAVADGAGPISRTRPGSFEEASRASVATGRGHGFLSTIDETADNGGARAQVYTFWHVDGQPGGTVTMALDFIRRAAATGPGKCGDGGHIQLDYEVFVREPTGTLRQEQRILPLARCGTPVPARVTYQRGAVPDLRIRR